MFFLFTVDACIDHLIQMSDDSNTIKPPVLLVDAMDSPRFSYQSGAADNIPDDADVVIESEEIESEPNSSTTMVVAPTPVATKPNLGAIKKRTSTSSSSPITPSPTATTIQTINTNHKITTNTSRPKSGPSQEFQYSTFLKDPTANQFELPPCTSNQQPAETQTSGGTFFKNNNKKQNKLRNEKSPNYDRIITLINSGIKLMVLMRGPSGCGKTHLARQVVHETVNGPDRNHIFSTDDFFCDINDRYNYDAAKVPDAHAYNQRRVRKKCAEGWSPVIVDNTHIQIWEMHAYVNVAVEYGYFIEILEPRTPWSSSPRQLATRNRHSVPLYRIERMVANYEQISVPNMLKSRELERHLELQPQMRRLPIFKPPSSISKVDPTKKLIVDDNPVTGQLLTICDQLDALQPEWDQSWTTDEKPPAQNDEGPKSVRLSTTTTAPRNPQEDVVPGDGDIDESSRLCQPAIDWKAHEQEVSEFWTKTKSDWEPPALEKPEIVETKGQRIFKRPTILDLNKVSVLEDNGTADEPPPPPSNPASSPDEMTTSPIKLEKHKIDCEHENKSFTQIRQIYPSVPIEYLWDLFENCQGDGDWTMDILLKDETKLNEFMIDDGKAHENKYFDCLCSKGGGLLISFDDIPNPTSPQSPGASGGGGTPKILQPTQTPSRQTKRSGTIASDDVQNTKRKIEEAVSLGNEHYSEHMLKIRDIRRGLQTEPKSPSSSSLGELGVTAGGAYAVFPGDYAIAGAADGDSESSETDNDEIIEVNLGMELVSQLDNMFGIEAYPRSTLETMKTNVFMSKSLAKQLYALWMESVYNQIEEQKQQSLRDDEEFARSLHAQEKYPELYKEPKNFKEIMEMQLTWAAYKAEIDEWKTMSPETMASKMSKDKLKSIFPGIEQVTLNEILAAHNNRFDETVTALQETLKFDVNEEQMMIGESKELFEQARVESEKVSSEHLFIFNSDNFIVTLLIPTTLQPTENYEIVRSRSSSSNRSLETKKLSADEAKRLALKDFEDCRNSAQHHTQLKAECYAKAQTAMQRGDTQVALYYSQVAKLHKNKVDMYNQKAANCIMEVHNLTQNNPDIIDLHYLHVPEALECLDIFLDKHVNKLKMSPQNSRYLHIITGRGLHSAGGIPTVKHNVKNRLRDRNLK